MRTLCDPMPTPTDALGAPKQDTTVPLRQDTIGTKLIYESQIPFTRVYYIREIQNSDHTTPTSLWNRPRPIEGMAGGHAWMAR